MVSLEEYKIIDGAPYNDPALFIDNEPREDMQIEQSRESNYFVPPDDTILNVQSEQRAVNEVGFDFLNDSLTTPYEFNAEAFLSQSPDDTETILPLSANFSLEIPELDNLSPQNGNNDCQFSNQEETSTLTMSFPITDLHVDRGPISSDPFFLQRFLDPQSTFLALDTRPSSLVGDQSTFVNKVQTLNITDVGEEPMGPPTNASLVLDRPSIDPITLLATPETLSERAEQSQNIQRLPLIKRRIRRTLKPIERGNNRHGRVGNLRCDACRRRKSKCVFANQWITCEYCVLHNVKEPCIKRRGPESEKVLNPDRDIIIPDDCRIDGEDGMMYQYSFSPEFVTLNKNFVMVSMWKKYRAGYGGFIPCISLRHAMLALAYFHMSSIYGESKVIQHQSKAYVALRKSTSETRDDGDLLAIYILCEISSQTGRKSEELAHSKGFLTVNNQFDSSERDSGVVSKFAVLRPLFAFSHRLGWPDFQRPDFCLLRSVKLRHVANACAELFALPKEFDLALWTGWDSALWPFYCALRILIIYRNTNEAATHESQKVFSSVVTKFTMELQDVPFIQIQGVLNQAVDGFGRMGPAVLEKCLMYLVVRLVLRIIAVGPLPLSFEMPETVIGAWKLVRLILHNKSSFLRPQFLYPHQVKFLLFLGSVFLPSSDARNIVQDSILAFLRSRFHEVENQTADGEEENVVRKFRKGHDKVSIEKLDTILLWFWEEHDVGGILEIILQLWVCN